MKRMQFYILIILSMMLAACQSMGEKGTIARLRNKTIDIKEEKIEGGLDKAMASYQRFLEQTPDAALAPEAIRRLADLKIEKEYGTLTEAAKPVLPSEGKTEPAPMAAPQAATPITTDERAPALPQKEGAAQDEADKAFEKRTTQSTSTIPPTANEAVALPEPADDLDKAGPKEAIALYQKLLKKYPLYDRNDQVLYQMSRAYEELGKIDEAMAVMARLVAEFPHSRYIDEVQFRRAEFFFTRRKFLDSEEAYKSIVDLGKGSYYYELALYKLGWTFYKQELYEDAQHRFIALLDNKVAAGYDFEQTEDETERKRTDDTFRVISLGFSNLGGADSVVEYFSENGKRSYENNVYSNLAEFYFDKRRYADAANAYNAFVERNPFHKSAPNFHMRVIEIHTAGGFPTLVLDAKKAYATTYGLNAEYWHHYAPSERNDVLDHLKTNLIDLANHYHAAYQKPHKKEEKPAHFKEAHQWYRQFIASFPTESETPAINYQLADLLLQNLDYGLAAVEYENTAYDYPGHEKSSEAGYAAVYAHRKHLESADEARKDKVKQDVVRSSMSFVDTFPQHEKADIVLGAAAEDLYAMKRYEEALGAGTKLLAQYPSADTEVTRTAWLVSAHSSFELRQYPDAENAYVQVLALLPKADKTRDGLVDNLAATIYKQGEQANAAQDYQAAADHFLRIRNMAPTTTILATAEYDGAAALIQLKRWEQAASVLVAFRNSFPDHELQPEVTKKVAFVYRENKQLSLAAQEYERIETESQDDTIRRDALQVAAELYEEDKDKLSALKVYRRYVTYFPEPVEIHMETRNKIADILKAQNDIKDYHKELRQMVAIDAAAGNERTPRTQYLAGKAALVLAELTYEQFTAVKLARPFKRNLKKKQKLMKKSTKAFNKLVDYEIGEITAAATFYLAEIYAHFSVALLESERPVLTNDLHKVRPGETLSGIAKLYEADVRRIARENNLNKSLTIVVGKKLKIPRGLHPEELEQYELAIEEQAYPFEDKAIEVHENNLKLIALGVYNAWIDKSIAKLAHFMPARYARVEQHSGIINALGAFTFAVARPVPPAPPATALDAPATESATPVQGSASDSVPVADPGVDEMAAPVTAAEPAAPVTERAPETPATDTMATEDKDGMAEADPPAANDPVAAVQ